MAPVVPILRGRHVDAVLYELGDELVLVLVDAACQIRYYSSSLGFWFLSSVIMFSSRRRVVMVVSGSSKYLLKPVS